MIQLHTLGAADLRRDGVEARSVLSQPKRLAVLVYLAAATPRGFHSRDTLLALFWPEADAERARNALRQALHYLRRSLGDDVVTGRGDREVGVDPEWLWCDAAAFDQALEEGRHEDALTLYRGDFLPGFYIEEASEAERWLEDERARRRRAATGAAWELAGREEARGEARAAVLWARRAVALDPGDEAALRRLLGLLERAGEPAAALEAYADFARRLEAEYGLAPAAETTALAERLRSRPAAEAVPVPAVPSAPKPVAPAQAPAVAPAVVAPPVVSAPATGVVGSASAGLWPDPGPASPQPVPAASPVAARAVELPPSPLPAAPAPREARRDARPARVRPRRPAFRMAVAAAGLLGVLLGGGWHLRTRTAATATAPAAAPSIVVLPFVNMSGDPANEYFSDGVTEELLNVLTRVPGLRVAARTSAFTFKGRNVPVDSIGRVLRVGHVLEGSVRAAGGKVRITAQLVDARTGFHLWSQTYDRELRDVFAVQDEISRAIVEALRVELGEGAGGALARAETADPEAHALVLRGQHAVRQATRESLAQAAAFYEEAVRRDPRYARALAGLANAYLWQAYMGHVPAAEGYPRARATAERALALDPGLADAHVVLGRVAQSHDADFAAAERHYERALALNPRDPKVHSRRAELLRRQGRTGEAIASARRAVELDPVSPGELNALASMLASVNRYPEALEANATALRFSPDHPLLLSNRAIWLAESGRAAEAVPLIERARERAPAEQFSLGAMAYIYARAGQRAKAETAAREFAARPDAPAYELAATYIVLGDRERTIDYLERSVARGEEHAVSLPQDSSFVSLRGHPRMQRLLARVRAGGAKGGGS